MKSPTVSVVIPCFNSKKYIEAAIASVYAQTVKVAEVIVVDDGSYDGSWEELHRLKAACYPELMILSHPDRANLGVSSTRSLGFSTSSGDYIAFLDSDDFFYPNKIESQLLALEKNPDVVLCHAAVDVFEDRSKADFFESVFRRNPLSPYHFREQKDYLIRHGICNSTTLIRSQVLRRIPFSISQAFQFEDWLCWSLLAPHGKFLFLDQRLAGYRVHEGSATASLSNQKLRHLYSLLEFKLALLARSESAGHALRVLFSIVETLRQLLVEYLWDPNAPGSGKTSRTNRKNALVRILLLMGTAVRMVQRITCRPS